MSYLIRGKPMNDNRPSSFKSLWNKLLGKKQFKIQSFTYYIPSPPSRSTGYREKQFDKVFHSFINRGYEVLSLKTQANTSPSGSGMWVICVVRALNKNAEALNLDDFSSATDATSTHDSTIPGPDTLDGHYNLEGVDTE
jgi:hypothetical protein